MESPAWTIQGKFKPAPSQLIPGPAAYGIPSSFSKITCSRTKSDRFAPSRSKQPSPGDYETQQTDKLLYGAFDKASRPTFLAKVPRTPGPSDYQISPTTNTLSFTMQGKSFSRTNNETPSPAHYKMTDSHLQKPATFKFGNDTRNRLHKFYIQVPGPGTYETEKILSARAHSFGRNHNGKSNKTHSPGPGLYEIPRSLSKLSYSIRKGVLKHKETKTPGPGTYEVSSIRDKRASSVGKATRFGGSPQKVPGPGTYQITSHNLYTPKKAVFRTSIKLDLKQQSPGPGTYTAPQGSTRSFVISRRFSNNLNEAPGPGAYESQSTQKQEPQAVIGKTAKEPPKSETERYKFPGPGSYNIKLAKGLEYPIGKGKRWDKIKEVSPGPGSYECASMIGNKHCRNPY